MTVICKKKVTDSWHVYFNKQGKSGLIMSLTVKYDGYLVNCLKKLPLSTVKKQTISFRALQVRCSVTSRYIISLTPVFIKWT